MYFKSIFNPIQIMRSSVNNLWIKNWQFWTVQTGIPVNFLPLGIGIVQSREPGLGYGLKMIYIFLVDMLEILDILDILDTASVH